MSEIPLTAPLKARILKQAQRGDLKLLKEVKLGAPDFHWSILKYDKTGDSILHCVARMGHKEAALYLLSFRPPIVDCKNNDDKTPLHEAAQFSQPELVNLLVDNGAQVNALKRADWTPLMLACTKSDYETVKILVDRGALIDYRNKDGWNSLHLSARTGSKEILWLLIERGGDWRARTKNGRSTLHIAALHGNTKIVEILLNERKKEGLEVDVRDNCGNTPLHEAILARNTEICRMLIAAGADIRSVNNVDFNLLHLASSEGYNDLIQFIVKELGFDINETNSSGFSALHCAARKKHKDTCLYLINLGCDQNIRDKFNRRASDYLNLGF